MLVEVGHQEMVLLEVVVDNPNSMDCRDRDLVIRNMKKEKVLKGIVECRVNMMNSLAFELII